MTDIEAGSRGSRLWANAVLPTLGVVITIALWWLATVVFHIDPFYVPSPADVVDKFQENPGFLLEETWITVQRVLIGFAIAVAGGLIIAVALASSRTVERMAMPVLAAINAIPKVALAPLLLV